MAFGGDGDSAMSEIGGLRVDLSYVLSTRSAIWFRSSLDVWRKGDSLRRFMLGMAGLYVGTLVALFWAGLRPAIPWGMVLVLPILFVPFAMLFLYYSRQHVHRTLDIAAAMFILVMYDHLVIWPLIGLVLLLSKTMDKIQYEWRLIRVGFVTTVLGYAALWNLNYLLARFRPNVHDPALRAVDEWIYSWFLAPVTYTKFFPVVHNDFLNQVLNNAYMLLFAEVILVLLLFCQAGDPDGVFRFLKGLFACYGIGVLCFVIYPAIGPCLYYPESFDPARVNVQIIQGMLHDYHAAINSEPLMGYGYFIAVPSLHVMIALYLQRCLLKFSSLFRVFLPVNVALIGSTVILGYHYIVDALIAILIIGIWLTLEKTLGSEPASLTRLRPSHR